MKMSRVIVKNLPENMKESRLRDIFAHYGEVTDIKLCFTEKGVFRKFAFIGYKSENEASSVLKALHKTFVGSNKIIVENCVNFGETPISRPWSKYSHGSSAFREHTKEVEERKKRISELQVGMDKDENKKNKKGSMLKEQLIDIERDEKFQEFLALYSNKQDNKIWSNENADSDNKTKEKKTKNKRKKDADADTQSDSSSEEMEKQEEEVKKNADKELDILKQSSDISEGNEINDYITIKMRGIPFKSNEQDIINFFKPLCIDDIRFAKDRDGKRTGYAFVDFKNAHDMKKALQKDKEKMEGRYVELFMAPHKDNTNKFHKKSWKVTEDVSDTGRLFIRNLSYTCTEEDLQNLFSRYGNLVEVRLPIDKNSIKSTGFAFITFMMPEHAMKAWTELDGKIFQGRILHIIPGKAKKEEEKEQNPDGSYKKAKEDKKKALSGSAHNWNALFLGQNAVADVMAERLNKSKRDLLDGASQSSVAVNMALGETELVNETRKFLESAGVNLGIFGQANSSRSKNVILVKNLPSGTTKEEMSEIFSVHGELGRVLIPPFGITAIIEFINSADAKKGFLSLAYSKFKHTPLYLEWAPIDVLSGEVTKVGDCVEGEEGSEESDDPETSEGTVIFVKNLSFATNEEKLKTIFATCGKIEEATIAKKKDKKKEGSMLSMGYGFVKFKKQQYANKAIKNLQGFHLDGHKLELKKSHRQTVAPKSSQKRLSNKKHTSGKIVVRNIPFEANEKEIKDLFKTFGTIKSVRLPKKMAGTGSHRGFAFIDFTTKQDAKRAYQALCLSTHLYGRRLVLEWAEDDDSIHALQEKTAQQYDQELEPPSKKRKRTLISSLEKGSAMEDDTG